MKSFAHKAREDQCVFQHWAPADDAKPYPYAAEKFHRRLRVFNFTESDFYRFLNDDPTWTYEEVRCWWGAAHERGVLCVPPTLHAAPRTTDKAAV